MSDNPTSPTFNVKLDASELINELAELKDLLKKASEPIAPVELVAEPAPVFGETEVAALISAAVETLKEELTKAPEPVEPVEPVEPEPVEPVEPVEPEPEPEVAVEFKAPEEADFEDKDVYTKSLENYNAFRNTLMEELKKESGAVITGNPVPVPGPEDSMEEIMKAADESDDLLDLLDRAGVQI